MAGDSNANGHFSALAYRLGNCFRRNLLLALVGYLGFRLAGGLVLGEVEFFLNLALTAGQLLITLFLLKGRTDFSFQLLGSLVESAMSDSSLAARSSKP